MTVVTKSDKKQSFPDYPDYPDYRRLPLSVMPTDTPEVDDKTELLYDFKDNNGKQPLNDPKSKLYLENPENVKTDVQYNPKTGNYDIKQKIGDRDYRPETYMNLKEYQDYVFKKSMRDYWRSRVAADDLNEKPRKGMIPKLQVNSELFDRIFGGNTVDIKPTGTAELIFGLNRSKNLNPAIPQRQQKITNFDFNMRIQLNLIGKIGDKLRVTTSYNTEASFDWENQVKLDYTGYEDEILKKIEAGNVTLPLNSSLISGSQTLFGFKTDLQFGRLRTTIVASQQRGKKQEVVVQGGAQTQPFSISADNYENNKHYFLSHYFRDNYDAWMQTLPIINTPVVITKVEVYISNINGTAEQTRKIAAFEDLGEDSAHVIPQLAATKAGSLITVNSGLGIVTLAIVDSLGSNNDPLREGVIPRNGANNLYAIMTNTRSGLIRERNVDNVSPLLASQLVGINPANDGGNYMVEGRDFNRVSNARRLNPSEYYFNPRTGFISLNQQLNNEQVLAVSFQYTYGNKIYQVGEFSDQIPDNNKLLVCKLLKPTTVSVKHPMWDLMMKNVYALGAYNLNQQDFKLDVFYNNVETGVDVPYLPYGKANGQVNGRQLIRVLNCDNLSVNGDRFSDGVFDFVSGFTILPNNGRVVFPTIEPFGRSLAKKFEAEDFPQVNNYIFYELYDSTKTAASFIQNKNRFKIKGTYRSSSGSEISLNALNIPQGAVVVTANGVPLVENTDYTVDYTLGRVKIINDGILNSGAQVKVSLESNSLFQVNNKTLVGTRLDYKAGRNLTLGSTILRFTERPITQKVNIGDEPVSNIVAGLDVNYKTDAPFITRLLDKLPFYNTKEMSSISTRGEIAKLFPGNARAIGKSGNSYIDDFEGSITLIDIRNPNGWFLSSIPQGQTRSFPEAAFSNSIITGMNRARLNWYTIDPMFTRSQTNTTPSYYNNTIFSNNMWRQVFETELFPGKTPPNGQQVVLPVLDLAFYPAARGPYNYDVKGSSFSKGINGDGSLVDPRSRWGGIMRRLETNDFQAANVEYIQFWMMDPFNEDYKVDTDSLFDATKLPEGDLYINLGNVSEDIVKDAYMSYENGLPGTSQFSSTLPVDTTNLAIVPLIPPTINAFAADPGDRAFQDVGYDGMGDANEQLFFANAVNDMQSVAYSQSAKNSFSNDPSSDNYTFFRDDRYDAARLTTLRRYAMYNNPQGNTPTEAQYQAQNADRYSTIGGSTLPNIEDINRDNTLSEIENYYQYRVHISKDALNPLTSIGTNFIVDAFNGAPAEYSGVPAKTVKWYQFKIPISQFEENIGGIEGFNSIRFMRVYMKGFDRPVVLRLARFELVRSDWRRYEQDLRTPGENIASDNNTTSFDISAVNVQENSSKEPVNYVLPPEIAQQQNVQTTNLVLQNEQALQMRVCDLKDGDSRAIFKNVDLDTRLYNNIKMNVHAEKLNTSPLNDGDLTLFFRVGTDYNNNYYEYEVPLILTAKGNYDGNNTDSRYQVWPRENEVNFKFDDIRATKEARNRAVGFYNNLGELSKPFSQAYDGYTVTIVGNPNLGTVKSVMAGIRNPKNDKLSHCAEVWINELRLTDFNNAGGWATTAQVQAKLADLGMVSLAGTYSTPFWGSVESKIGTRNKETNFNWDMSSSLNAGKFFPDAWKVTLPVFYNYGQTIITPLFNPLDPDVRMKDVEKNPDIDNELKQDIKEQVLDYTQRKGFNFSNVRIDGFKRKGAKPMPWDVSNFSATYAFNEVFKRSVNVESNVAKQYRGNVQYAYSIQNPLTIKPFNKMKIFENRWFALIKDFNLQLVPNGFGVAVEGSRTFSSLKNRDITSFYTNSNTNDFVNPVLYNKNFLINRAYNFRWDFNKALKFDYTANNEGRVLEPFGDVSKKNSTARDSVISNLKKGGTNTQFRQQMNLSVTVPLNKIPAFDFISTLNYRYGGTFTWTRMPFAIPDNESIGNSIQNTNTHNITVGLTMLQLYNKIPYFKRVNSPPVKQGATLKGGRGPASAQLAKGVAQESADTLKKPKKFKNIGEFLARGVMMLKSVNVTFMEQGGQGLPNFRPNSQYGGMDFNSKAAPGFLFTTGLYDANIRQRSLDNNWLVVNRNQTTPYTEMQNRNYTYRALVEPHGSLKIDLTGNYSKQLSKTSYMGYGANDRTANPFDSTIVFGQSPNETGNFDISTFTLFRAFKDGNSPVNSKLFDQFLEDRSKMAGELSDKNTASNKAIKNDGYSSNQQDVLIGSFYRTYTGRSIKNYATDNIFPTIPLPNWTVSWDGLGKLKPLKKTFNSITVRHGYRSSYRVSSFTNDILYNTSAGNPQNARMPVTVGDSLDTTPNNFVSYYHVNSVTISEAFSPLLKFDLRFVKTGWSANLETRRDKTTTLNITGYQIVETKGQEYIVGLGYMIPRLKLKNVQIQGKAVESNLILKLDLSYRENLSVIRDLTQGSSVPTGGTDIITMRSSADYQLTPNINLRIFYDWIRTKPQTSASFPTSSATGGFSLRINFQ